MCDRARLAGFEEAAKILSLTHYSQLKNSYRNFSASRNLKTSCSGLEHEDSSYNNSIQLDNLSEDNESHLISSEEEKMNFENKNSDDESKSILAVL